MAKTYSTKSNALRAFKAAHPQLAAAEPDNKAIAAKYIQDVSEAYAQGERGAEVQAEPGTVWAIVIPADVRVVKRHIYKGVPFRRKSLEPEGITSAVHDMFDEYQAEAEERGKALTRKQYIARAVRDGVAYYTARTQYQKWSKGA